jgi:hypothetical protein
MIEINSLRILNDYLNQTIDALVRTQRLSVNPLTALGLSHSPFAQTPFGVSPFGVSPFGVSAFPYGTVGADPTQMGLGHSPYATHGVPFAGAVGGSIGQSYPIAIDPFMAQRGLSHTSAVGTPWAAQGTPWAQTYNPLAEIARQQQLQALAAYRAWGVPV